MPKFLKIVIPAVVALVIGLLIGFFVGRSALQRQWAQPYAIISPVDAIHSASEDGDATPPVGSKVLKPMPIGRARAALASMTADDKATCPHASVGSDDEGLVLHVTVENKGACKITSASGIAYGFDPHGMPAATNKHGESYVAFKLDAPVEPGKRVVAAQKLRYASAATLAVAQIDAATCADGSTWKRQ
jgi:hypothetical protein